MVADFTIFTHRYVVVKKSNMSFRFAAFDVTVKFNLRCLVAVEIPIVLRRIDIEDSIHTSISGSNPNYISY